LNYDSYFYYDDPVPYKGMFYMSIPTLIINKNRIPDIKIIQMKYLDYILYLINEELEMVKTVGCSQIIQQFYSLLCLSFQIDINQIDIVQDENNKAVLKILNYKNANGEVRDIFLTGSEFDDVKQIICDYNMVELPDEKIDPVFEQAIEDARKFRNKNADIMGSLEDQFVCIMISSSLTLDDIKNLTIRKYQKILERVDFKLHYQIYRTAEVSGAEFKQPIQHWRAEIKNDKYEGLVVDYDSTVDKFNQK